MKTGFVKCNHPEGSEIVERNCFGQEIRVFCNQCLTNHSIIEGYKESDVATKEQRPASKPDTPRVVVVIEGGMAEVYCDEAVEVTVLDFDITDGDAEENPEDYGVVKVEHGGERLAYCTEGATRSLADVLRLLRFL